VVDLWRIVDVVQSAIGPFEQQVDPAGFPARFLFSMKDDPSLQRLLRIAGPAIYLFPSDKNQSGHPDETQNRMAQDPEAGENSEFSDLRSSFDVCYPAERWRRGRRVGDTDASAGRREGLQEILEDETSDEARGFGEDNRQANEAKGFDTFKVQ
jgi:hypothetical protein